MIKIAIDLELERNNDGIQVTDSTVDKPEIIQLGICVFNSVTGEILQTTSLDIHKPYRLSTYIQKLTKIKPEDLNNSSLTIHDAYNYLVAIRDQYDASRNIIEWGAGDMAALLAEVQPEQSSFGSAINAKHLYQMIMQAKGLNDKGGLAKSLGKLGMQFKPWNNHGKHQAGADSFNTARLYLKLLELCKTIDLTIIKV
jgi:inhibitor of KinA sporulation pathway (predicted exonuclease)